MILRPEELEQRLLIAYIRTAYPKILFTIAPNGFKLTKQLANRIKALGYSPGTPDVMIFEQRGIWAGLFIEMKRRNIKGQPKGHLSDYQKYWIESLNKRGYFATCCHGFEEAKVILDNYLNNK